MGALAGKLAGMFLAVALGTAPETSSGLLAGAIVGTAAGAFLCTVAEIFAVAFARIGLWSLRTALFPPASCARCFMLICTAISTIVSQTTPRHLIVPLSECVEYGVRNIRSSPTSFARRLSVLSVRKVFSIFPCTVTACVSICVRES